MNTPKRLNSMQTTKPHCTAHTPNIYNEKKHARRLHPNLIVHSPRDRGDHFGVDARPPIGQIHVVAAVLKLVKHILDQIAPRLDRRVIAHEQLECVTVADAACAECGVVGERRGDR